MKYFEVLVMITTESEGRKGATKIKKVKESYLVDALTCTEAEARVIELFEKSGFSQDYEVVGVKNSKIIEVVAAEEKKEKKLKSLGVRLKTDEAEKTKKEEDLEEDPEEEF